MDVMKQITKMDSTEYSDRASQYEGIMQMYRALIKGQMADRHYKKHKNSLFAALRAITEWQRGEDRTHDTVQMVFDVIAQAQDAMMSDVLETINPRRAEPTKASDTGATKVDRRV